MKMQAFIEWMVGIILAIMLLCCISYQIVLFLFGVEVPEQSAKVGTEQIVLGSQPMTEGEIFEQRANPPEIVNVTLYMGELPLPKGRGFLSKDAQHMLAKPTWPVPGKKCS